MQERMRIYVLLLLLLTSGGVLTINAQGNRVSIVPYPQEVHEGRGEYQISHDGFFVSIEGVCSDQEKLLFEEIRAEVDKCGRKNIELTDEGKGGLKVHVFKNREALVLMKQKLKVESDVELGEEGYILRVSKKQVSILSETYAGALYGVQSLKQLIRGAEFTGSIPVLTIIDWPNIALRCIMDDISRGPIPTEDYMKYQIRRYAEMKINSMSFYIEHVVRTDRYPDFAPSNGGIPIDEFKRLSEYAEMYNIELIGNFQSLGHFEKILSFPQYRNLGATERMLDPLNPASMEFLRNIYMEMAPAFSSEFFTPDCDEAWDLSRGKLSNLGGGLTVEKIYADHVKSIDTTLRDLGKRSIIWGDIIKDHPGIMDLLPKDIVIGAWAYGADESFAAYIDPIVEAGFDFTVSPGVLNSRRLIPDFEMTTTNIRNFINEGYEKGCIGVYCTVWDDGGMHFFSHDWYGLAYNAEQSWRPNKESLQDFDLRFSKGIYADAGNTIPRALHQLNALSDLGPTFEMNSNVFWKTLIPEKGSKQTFNPGSWEDVRLYSDMTKDILSSSSIKQYKGDLDYIDFTCRQYLFMAESRDALLEASKLYSKALFSQLKDRSLSLSYLEKGISLLNIFAISHEGLAKDFKLLWRQESREYWLNRAEDAYDKRQEAIDDMIILLNDAREQFLEGAFLPTPNEVRLDIREQDGQYFQFWLLSGSYSISLFEESSKDFLTTIGGEAEVRPFPGMKFKDADGIDREWIKYDSPHMQEVDLKSIFEPHVTAVAYAYCTIDVPKDMTVEALFGSNDGALVYCNGEEVHRIHSKRSLIPDEDKIGLQLKEGRNHILIKVEQWKADWGFTFRLKDVDIRSHKQKYYIK